MICVKIDIILIQNKNIMVGRDNVVSIATLCRLDSLGIESWWWLNFSTSSKKTSRSARINIYILTPWCRVLLEKLTGLQLVKKFPAFHGTRRFITALTSVRHLSLSWARPIQSIAAALSDPALYRLLTFQVPIIIPLCLLRDASPGNTPPPGDPSGGGVVYLRIVLSPEQTSRRN